MRRREGGRRETRDKKLKGGIRKREKERRGLIGRETEKGKVLQAEARGRTRRHKREEKHAGE